MKINASYLKRLFMFDYEVSLEFAFRRMYRLQELKLIDYIKISLEKEGAIGKYWFIIMLHKYKYKRDIVESVAKIQFICETRATTTLFLG